MTSDSQNDSNKTARMTARPVCLVVPNITLLKVTPLYLRLYSLHQDVLDFKAVRCNGKVSRRFPLLRQSQSETDHIARLLVSIRRASCPPAIILKWCTVTRASAASIIESTFLQLSQTWVWWVLCIGAGVKGRFRVGVYCRSISEHCLGS